MSVRRGRLLVVTGGHSFDELALCAMLDSICLSIGWSWEHAEHPNAQSLLTGDNVGVWDAILLYDLPGLELSRGVEPHISPPSESVKAGIRAMVASGQGFVALHHALAGWPTWDEWATMLRGRFLYAPGSYDGSPLPASGYRMTRYRVLPTAQDHPVCAGIAPFELSDELYRCPVFDDSISALLHTDVTQVGEMMIDAYRQVADGEKYPAAQQPGNTCLGWTTSTGSSRTVYVLPGHGSSTMEHPMYRRLIGNALTFVSSL